MKEQILLIKPMKLGTGNFSLHIVYKLLNGEYKVNLRMFNDFYQKYESFPKTLSLTIEEARKLSSILKDITKDGKSHNFSVDLKGEGD